MDEDAAIAEQGPAGRDGDDAIVTQTAISDLSFLVAQPDRPSRTRCMRHNIRTGIQ